MYLDFAAIVLAVGLFFAALAWLADRRLDAPVDQPPRPDRHLSADEYRLLGDDWRDCAAPYFAESFIRSTRTRFAIAATCGADPEKKTPARVESPGALTPSKEISHARSARQ